MFLGPSRVSSSNLRAPTAVAAPQIKPPATTFAKPDPVRKYSGIARPTSSGGIPRPGGGVSRLPGPGGARLENTGVLPLIRVEGGGGDERPVLSKLNWYVKKIIRFR